MIRKKKQPSDIRITLDEYPPKWVGTKGNGMRKMVYRLDENDPEMGLVFHRYNQTETEYVWEHFDLIQKYK
jgi:hypothetical protein